MEHLAHFRILAKMGAGGMGEVYRARDEKLQRDVAIKILAESQFSDPNARPRLLREARAAAGLSHPNICVVHEVGESDGKAYIAMECVEGETLSSRLAREPLAPSDAIRFGVQLADALAHAHQRGVVHRDLKPANVIITPDRRVKVLDFGLAHRVSTQGTDPAASTDVLVTAHGVVAGTPAYMSPEQLRGKPADERSDIWALGVILHEMLTSDRPFDGATWPELSAAILTSAPRRLPPAVPPELQVIVARCLAKDPADRYQTAAELRSALSVLQTGVISGPIFPDVVPRRRWPWIAAALAAAIVLVMGAFLYFRPTASSSDAAPSANAAASAEHDVRAIAILPFANFSGPDEEYLAEGMQDAVIGELARVDRLRVISRTSTAKFRGSNKSTAEIPRALNADELVEGSVVRAGDRVRVQMKLIRTIPEEKQIWADVYERDLRDVFALYAEIGQAVASKLDPRLTTASRPGSARQVDPEIYRLYLRGMFHVKKQTPAGFEAGLAYLRQATERDPADPLPWAGMAIAYANLAHSPAGTHQVLELARAAAKRALEIDQTQAEAHAAIAMVKLYDDWNWAGLEQDFRNALDRNPTLPEIRRHFGWYLIMMKRADEALAEMKVARDTDPLSGVYYGDVALVLLDLGRNDEALAEARKGVAVDQSDPFLLWALGVAYVNKAMYAEAIETHRKMVSIDPWFKFGLAQTYIHAGRAVEAQPIIEEMKKQADGLAGWGLASIYAATGNNDEAFRWLEVARDKRFLWAPWTGVHFEFVSLRSDPRFAKLLASMNVPNVEPGWGRPESRRSARESRNSEFRIQNEK